MANFAKTFPVTQQRGVLRGEAGKSELTTARAILRELAAAFAVIAVFALTFVYQPLLPAAVAKVGAGFYDLSSCGAAPGDDGAGNHGPCHACRLKTAILPPPPISAVPAFSRFYHVTFFTPDDPATASFAVAAYNPRAPPFNA